MSNDPVPQTDDDWVFDEQCPECGEEVYLSVIIEKYDNGDPARAVLLCGERYYNSDLRGEPIDNTDEQGCGHTWEWVADE